MFCIQAVSIHGEPFDVKVGQQQLNHIHPPPLFFLNGPHYICAFQTKKCAEHPEIVHMPASVHGCLQKHPEVANMLASVHCWPQAEHPELGDGWVLDAERRPTFHIETGISTTNNHSVYKKKAQNLESRCVLVGVHRALGAGSSTQKHVSTPDSVKTLKSH